MKVEVLSHWTLKTGLCVRDNYLRSSWVTGGLCMVIVASLLAVVYVKYENHRLYAELKRLEARTHTAYREHQVVSSLQVRNIGYDSVHRFIAKKNMVIYKT